jgi:hypothetical protein
MKNKINNAVNWFMFILCLMSVCSLDSESWMPLVTMICSGAWLIYAAWKNGWFDEEAEEGDF